MVARGHSLFGAPWQIRFGEEAGSDGEADRANFLFTVGDRAERRHDESGYYSSVQIPIGPRFTFAPTFGSDFDRFPEADVSGTAGPRVKRVALKTSDGSVFEAELLAAPIHLLERYPRLRPFRFFDLFFPDSAEPASLAAYGRHHKLLQRFSLGKKH